MVRFNLVSSQSRDRTCIMMEYGPNSSTSQGSYENSAFRFVIEYTECFSPLFERFSSINPLINKSTPG